MAVTIVQAGKRSAASIALVTNGWRGRRLDCCPQSGHKRRWVRVLENSRRDERGHGDVVKLIRLMVVILPTLLLMHHDGLGARRF